MDGIASVGLVVGLAAVIFILFAPLAYWITADDYAGKHNCDKYGFPARAKYKGKRRVSDSEYSMRIARANAVVLRRPPSFAGPGRPVVQWLSS